MEIYSRNERKFAACTVFEGKIVVSGGVQSNTVESYDFYENKWTYLPSMIEYRYFHVSLGQVVKFLIVSRGSLLIYNV